MDFHFECLVVGKVDKSATNMQKICFKIDFGALNFNLVYCLFGYVQVWLCSNFKEKESGERYDWALVNWDNGSFISVCGLKWSALIGKQQFCE